MAVALSGGKDSAVALVQAVRYFRRRPKVRIVALTADEGISGYRDRSLVAARALTERLEVEHVVLSARERLGVTTDDATIRLRGTAPCSFCGVWRRSLLNRAAREVDADVLVLGFNLDDLAQTVLMNFARAEVDRIARMAPHRGRQAGLVPRVAPLADVPEREVFLYARTAGLEFDHGECPHATAAVRNVFREVVWRLEEELPGTRQALLRSRERILDLTEQTGVTPGVVGRCRTCGEPAAGEQCRSCAYLGLAGATVIPTAG